MIQRIQSLFLVLAALFVLASFFFPLAEIKTEKANYELVYRAVAEKTQTGFTVTNTAYLLAGILTLTFFVILYTVFLFKNRKKQMKMCMISSLFIIFSTLGIVYFGMFLLPKSDTVFTFAAFFPLLAFLLTLAARNRIRKDEELVRSVDRIR
jgi:lipid-A-disaccharide synthase-like uncharacterized protein